jgi:hypothetical protein
MKTNALKKNMTPDEVCDFFSTKKIKLLLRKLSDGKKGTLPFTAELRKKGGKKGTLPFTAELWCYPISIKR